MNGVFIYYSNSQIQKHLGCSGHTAINALDELERVGLIRKEYQKKGRPIKIYVNDIRPGDRNVCYSAHERSQDKLSQKPYYNSFNKEKTHTNHSPKEEKQVNFDVDITLTQMQKNRRNFGEIKIPKKKKED